jgi:hypothetical protein
MWMLAKFVRFSTALDVFSISVHHHDTEASHTYLFNAVLVRLLELVKVFATVGIDKLSLTVN